MSNPFDQNPWQSQPTNGPQFGNAYESDHGRTYHQTQPGFSSSGYNNAWTHHESNKTEYSNSMNEYPSMPAEQNAYQYSGTAYGNQPQTTGSAYSSAPLVVAQEPAEPVAPMNQSIATSSAGLKASKDEKYYKPTAAQFWLRFIILLASIGFLGFATGAQPYSGERAPFYTYAHFYYMFGVAALSIIYAACLLLFYCYGYIKKRKINRPIKLGLDLGMAILWGAGVLVSAIRFPCKGGHKFCRFYDVSLFFGFFAFASYLAAILWDAVIVCRGKNR